MRHIGRSHLWRCLPEVPGRVCPTAPPASILGDVCDGLKLHLDGILLALDVRAVAEDLGGKASAIADELAFGSSRR